MRRLLVTCLLMSAFAVGCVGEIANMDAGTGGGSGMGGGAATGGGTTMPDTSAKLTWIAPTKNADNTPLTDLAGYKVKRGTAPGVHTAQTIDVGNVTTHTVDNLPSTTHYFVVTAYDTAGNESAVSNEASKVIP